MVRLRRTKERDGATVDRESGGATVVKPLSTATAAAVKNSELSSLGWREWVALPDLAVDQIKAKVDTGARSSALHAYNMHIYYRAGRPHVSFEVHPFQRDAEKSVSTRAEVVAIRNVRSSSGQVELRPVIHTHIAIGEHVWPIELTLTNRDEMGFRMLLGRQAIRGRFLVDGGRSYLQGRKRRKKKEAR